MKINYDYENVRETLESAVVYDTEFPIIRSRKRFTKNSDIPKSAKYVLDVGDSKVTLKLCKPDKYNAQHYWQVKGNKNAIDVFRFMVGAL